VADGSKVGQVFLARICPVGNVSELITDQSADPAALDLIRRSGTEVIIADA
jgi:DeoR family transcriptional regulator of aga operon